MGFLFKFSTVRSDSNAPRALTITVIALKPFLMI
jgi:hypothetical protein